LEAIQPHDPPLRLDGMQATVARSTTISVPNNGTTRSFSAGYGPISTPIRALGLDDDLCTERDLFIQMTDIFVAHS
jgi:hypothetical protein